MKKISYLLIRIFALLALCTANGENVAAYAYFLRGLDYIQRGVLSFGDCEISVTAYVKHSSDGGQSLLLDSDGGTLARVVLNPDGSVAECSGGAFFPASFAHKFVLRDFRAVLGLYTGGETAAFFNCDALPVFVRGDDFKIRFSDYNFEEGIMRKIPRRVEIDGGVYKLSLFFTGVLNGRK